MKRTLYLTEASPRDIMSRLAKMASEVVPEKQVQQSNPQAPKDPKDFVTQTPCIVFLANNGQHSEQKLTRADTESGSDYFRDFAKAVLKLFDTSVVFRDKNNYSATFYMNVNGRTEPVRTLDMQDGKYTVGEPYNYYQTTLDVTDVTNDTTSKEFPEKLRKTADAPSDIRNFLKELEQQNQDKPTLDSLDKISDIEDLQDGEDIFSLKIEEQSVPRVSLFKYIIDSIDTENQVVSVISADENTQGESGEISFDDITSGDWEFFKGTYEPEFDYDTAVFVQYHVEQLTGRDAPETWDGSAYMSKEKWDEWSARHKVATESLNLSKNTLYEDTSTSKWKIKIDFNDETGDNTKPSTEITITAPDDTLAKKYAEQYIRMKAFSDDTWKDATISGIQFEGEEGIDY